MADRLKLFVFFVSMTYVSPASAYIDPGSTLLLIQGLLALVGGIVVFVKHPIRAIKSLYARLRKHDGA